MHSFPILENLSEHFLRNFLLNLKEEGNDGKINEKFKESEIARTKREMLFKSLPSKGKLDLGVIKDSVYFFS